MFDGWEFLKCKAKVHRCRRDFGFVRKNISYVNASELDIIKSEDAYV